MPVFVRYWLFQIPELLAIGAGLGLLVWAEWLEPHWLALALLGDIAKDALMYPWLRSGYASEPSRYVGPERLLGSRGVATEELGPGGYVRISGELWRARSADGGALAAGSAVRVQAVEGLSLIVVADSGEAPAPGPGSGHAAAR